VSDWGFFSFQGGDAKKFLQGLVTADVSALAPGGWLASCVLTPKGLLTADFDLYDRGADLLAATRPAAAEGFERAFRTKIMLSSSAFERLRPRAALVVGAGFDGGLPWPRLGEPARLLIDAAAPAGAEPLGAAEFEALRLAAGFPLYGVDMDDGTLPLEARQESAISLTKGCYMGQETVSRIVHRGKVNRRLARLRFSGRAPAAGASVARDGAECGAITSAAGPWALAMLRAEASAPGTRVAAGGADAEVVD
jgi:folate-binding protein YgfZ